jgi:manganese/zinc/iron transport system permease protein
LGAASGLIGLFLFLRRKALLSDVIAHSTLPGVAVGFLIAFSLGWNDGRNLPVLLFFAALFGGLGGVTVSFLIRRAKLQPDIAMASSLACFYGLGTVLLSTIQSLDGGARAGLNHFLLGQAASMNFFEVVLISVTSLILMGITLRYFKIYFVETFDPVFAQVQGLHNRWISLAIILQIVIIVCVGLKTVGLIMSVAFLIFPPVCARLITHHPRQLAGLSVLFGASMAGLGTSISAFVPNAPTGPSIILVAFCFFLILVGLRRLKSLKSQSLKKVSPS